MTKAPGRCPTCDGPAVRTADNAHRPFCCERCRLLDLSRWLDEDYVVSEPAAVTPQPDEDVA